jgi:predicted metal-dependent phosphotriesterase family hydrolase
LIETVTGPVAAERRGVTLMHEHVLVYFIGAAQVSPSRYDADAAFHAVLPHLHHVKRMQRAGRVHAGVRPRPRGFVIQPSLISNLPVFTLPSARR